MSTIALFVCVNLLMAINVHWAPVRYRRYCTEYTVSVTFVGCMLSSKFTDS